MVPWKNLRLRLCLDGSVGTNRPGNTDMFILPICCSSFVLFLPFASFLSLKRSPSNYIEAMFYSSMSGVGLGEVDLSDSECMRVLTYYWKSFRLASVVMIRD